MMSTLKHEERKFNNSLQNPKYLFCPQVLNYFITPTLLCSTSTNSPFGEKCYECWKYQPHTKEALYHTEVIHVVM